MKHSISLIVGLIFLLSNLTAQNIEPLMSKATAWNLDSTYSYNTNNNQWNLRSKQISINYNPLGKTVDYYRYSLSKVGAVIMDSIHINYFDDQVKTQEYIQYKRENTAWSDTAIYYLYNEQGLTLYSLYHYVPDYGYKYYYYFNSQNQEDSIIKFIYDDFTNDWGKSGKNMYYYAPNGLLNNIIEYRWSNGWKLDKKTEYRYYQFSFGYKVDTIIKYKYDSQSQTWQNYFLYRYIYTSTGQVAEKYIYSWNDDLQQWLRIKKTVMSYDDTLLTQKLIYSYRADSANDLIGKDKYLYTYNSLNLLISEEWLIYNFDSSQYYPYQKITFDYNADKIMTEFAYYYWDNSINDWAKMAKMQFFYSKITYSDVQKQLNNITLYPNPVIDKINLKNVPSQSQLRILSLDGSIIYIQKLFNNNSLQVQFLQPGTYILKIITPQNKTYNLKFIKL